MEPANLPKFFKYLLKYDDKDDKRTHGFKILTKPLTKEQRIISYHHIVVVADKFSSLISQNGPFMTWPRGGHQATSDSPSAKACCTTLARGRPFKTSAFPRGGRGQKLAKICRHYYAKTADMGREGSKNEENLPMS